MTTRRPTEQSIRFARSARKAACQDLMATGLSETQAEAWCSAWEAEAARQNLSSDSRFFWDAGRGWIDAQRSASPVSARRPVVGASATRSATGLGR
jgi:hypothetical protein